MPKYTVCSLASAWPCWPATARSRLDAPAECRDDIADDGPDARLLLAGKYRSAYSRPMAPLIACCVTSVARCDAVNRGKRSAKARGSTSAYGRSRGNADSPATRPAVAESTSSAAPLIALGCQTTKVFCFARPAAAKNADQSMPGAWRAKSARVQRLSALRSSADASGVAWLSAMAVSSAHRRRRVARAIESGELQQWRDVALVFGAPAAVGRGIEVLLASGQAEATLQQEDDIGRFAVAAGFHRQA